MSRLIKSILCMSLAACMLLCGCGAPQESQSETTAETTAAATTVPAKPAATIDETANVKRYDFLSIKQKTDEINSAFNGYVSERRFKGVIYMKLGNDFEYLSATGSSDGSVTTLSISARRVHLTPITTRTTRSTRVSISARLQSR